MKSINAGGLPSRRASLENAERDLEHRMERRIAALDGAWHMNDPLYQRLWGALSRVRRELSLAENTVDSGAERVDCLEPRTNRRSSGSGGGRWEGFR
jgi:hypothetical protein